MALVHAPTLMQRLEPSTLRADREEEVRPSAVSVPALLFTTSPRVCP